MLQDFTRLAAEFQELEFQRKDIPEYSPLAVREVLVNALAHADYSLLGGHIQIAIFKNRLEIQNPGMLPFGFTMDDLKAGISRIRNRVIARVFHELQLMERWGSGYKRILEICREGGYPQPRWEELGASIRVTFYPHARAILQEPEAFILQEEREEEYVTEREKAILALFKKEGRLPFRNIHKKLTPRISERMLRYDLASLKKRNSSFPKARAGPLFGRRKNERVEI